MRANSAPLVCRSRTTQQADRREEQPGLHRRERHDGAGRDRDVADDEVGRDHVDDRRDDRQEDLHDREEPLTGHLLSDLQADLVAVLVAVALRLGALLVEALRQQDAGDAQGLLRDRGHVRQRLLRLGRDLGADLPHPALGDHEQRQQDDGDEGHLPAEQQHGDDRGDHRHGVAEHRRDRVVQHAGDAADVVLQARLDDTGLRAGEEREFHPLEVTEQPHAHRAHDLVADGRGQVRLPDPDAGARDPQGDHQADEHVEHRQVRAAAALREQALVERPLGEERRDDGDRRPHEDETTVRMIAFRCGTNSRRCA